MNSVKEKEEKDGIIKIEMKDEHRVNKEQR